MFRAHIPLRNICCDLPKVVVVPKIPREKCEVVRLSKEETNLFEVLDLFYLFIYLSPQLLHCLGLKFGETSETSMVRGD